MSAMAPAPALACVPSASPATERQRHFELARELFTTLAQERVPLPDGYAFKFASDEFEAVARFVTNERRCNESRMMNSPGPISTVPPPRPAT